ncbi:HAD family hydrolase [Halopseudomonas pelagia]|uniref:HAD family hydrolase n=1 Tax=Halopseudomonas pelagia TaxID=553151 RepID=UPI00039D6AB5|nr:HAD family hydrolase [Halopseudomonas pelagia]|tara:strand:- start:17825 stop:18544 length:720 start_codon:yes stop_codon:yes gene_type:complete
MIRLLTFDLDNTLWETESVVAAAEQTLMTWYAEHAPQFAERLDSDARKALRHEVLANDPLLRHRVTDFRIAVMALGLTRAGYAEEQVQELTQKGFEVFLEARHALTLFPHAEALLEQLSTRYTLATISNGNADVRRLGLAKYFSVIVSADEVGISKPDPAPFLTALERAGVEPAHALHIGDHPVDDMQGARESGLHTLWFNRMGAAWPDAVRPDGEVRCLSQIPAWLDGYTAKLTGLRT